MEYVKKKSVLFASIFFAGGFSLGERRPRGTCACACARARLYRKMLLSARALLASAGEVRVCVLCVQNALVGASAGEVRVCVLCVQNALAGAAAGERPRGPARPSCAGARGQTDIAGKGVRPNPPPPPS